MAKVRNTFAKHQREQEKRHKADQKRVRRAQKAQQAEESVEPELPPVILSEAERSVLSLFRTTPPTPRNTYAFSNADLAAFKLPLAQLTGKGLLAAADAPGVYSLTDTGFAALDGDESNG